MTFPLRNTICNFPKIPVKTISVYRQPENGRKIPNSSALLITYFEGFMGLSASETFMDLIASSKKLGPHQARAPVQKVTQVKPKVEKMKDLLPKRLFRSSE